MRNKQALCVCYFLFVPQWTHSAGTQEGEQRRWSRSRRGNGAGWGPRQERGPLPGAEAPDPCASARGLPTSDTQIPRPAQQDLVQVPEKEWMPRSYKRGLRRRLRGPRLCPGWLSRVHFGGAALGVYVCKRRSLWNMKRQVLNILMQVDTHRHVRCSPLGCRLLNGECTNLNQWCHRRRFSYCVRWTMPDVTSLMGGSGY